MATAYTKFTDLETSASMKAGTSLTVGTTATITGAASVGGALTVTGAITNTALTAALAAGLKFLKVGTIDINDGSDTPTALTDANIPANSMITQVICNVTEVFNSGDSDTIAVGISGTANKFLATSDITATTLGGYTKIQAYESGESDLTIYATWAGAGTQATTGSADIYVVYFEE